MQKTNKQTKQKQETKLAKMSHDCIISLCGAAIQPKLITFLCVYSLVYAGKPWTFAAFTTLQCLQ